jgi:hypothetical protein
MNDPQDACIGIRRQGGRMIVFGGKRLSGGGGLQGECMAQGRPRLCLFFILDVIHNVKNVKNDVKSCSFCKKKRKDGCKSGKI